MSSVKNSVTTIHGIVLSSMPMGETDRRLSILTKEYGRISAFAKGARKQNSSLVAVSQPFTYAEFGLFMGRSSNTLVSAEKPNFFMGIRESIDAMYYGMYFCELAEYLTRENNDESEYMALLYSALRALERSASGEAGNMPLDLIRRVYELKAISVFGEAPLVFECTECGKTPEGRAIYFDSHRHGIVCGSCMKQLPRFGLSDSSLYALQYVVSKPANAVFSFNLSDAAKEEFLSAVDDYMGAQLDRPMKSLEVLEGL